MKFNKLLDFLGLLRESQKLFFRNGKPMFFITLLTIFVTSSLLAVIRLITDASIKASSLEATSPTSAEFAGPATAVKYDFRLLLAVKWIFILGICFTSLFFAIASILASAVSYCGNDLSIKELLSKAVKSLNRPFVTWLYIALFDLAYFLFLFSYLLPLVLILQLKTIPTFLIVECIVSLVAPTYLAVVWNLALVVSVLEEKYGIEALEKAGQLIKGSKLRGCFLNFVLAISSWVFFYLYQTGSKLMPAKAQIIPFLFLNCIVCLITLVSRMAYTVLYYECKATHGEELELQGTLEYTKVNSAADTV